MKQCSEQKEQLEGLLFARSDITSSPICIRSLLTSLWPLACSILATHLAEPMLSHWCVSDTEKVRFIFSLVDFDWKRGGSTP